MTIDYLTNIRFGYGPLKHASSVSALSMPETQKARFPNLSPSFETIPLTVRGRSNYLKFAKAGDNAGYENAVAKYYDDNNSLYAKNALERIKFSARSNYGFFERLVYFWENHLAIMTSNKTTYTVVVAGYETEAIRPHIDGYFRDLLTAAVTHPAMLLTLDQHASMGEASPVGFALGRGSNENLGRELLELHTLGVDGGYGQYDVEQLAGLLTGLNVDYDTGKTGFYYSRSQPGSFHVLGKSYGGLLKSHSDIVEVIHDLSIHPATGKHLCSKLAKHFISDTPPDALIADMTDQFVETGGFLPAIYEVLLTFDDPAYQFAKVKTPIDFVISGLRAFGAPDSAFSNTAKIKLNRSAMVMDQVQDSEPTLPDLTVGALDALGHRVWGPPGPDGWPDNNSDWLHSVGLTKRMAWASGVAPFASGSALEFLDSALGELASNETRQIVGSTNSALEGVMLALMSPEFNRR